MHNTDNNIHTNDEPSAMEQMELRRALIKSQAEMPDVEEEWKRFSQTITDDSEEEQVTTRSIHLYRWVAGVAAAIILAIVCVMPSRKTTSVEVFSAKADATDIVISTDDGEKQVVKVGDRVEKGQLIGAASEGLSVNVHSSVSGIVTKTDDKSITIVRA